MYNGQPEFELTTFDAAITMDDGNANPEEHSSGVLGLRYTAQETMANQDIFEQPSLRQQQLAFANAIRHPQKKLSVEGVATDRMAVYRELFFNNFKETLSSAFPVLHKVLPVEQWTDLCARFFADHPCRSPYLAYLPREFLRYLHHHPVTDPPWLYELAQWEWTELDLFLAPDVTLVKDGNDVLNHVPVLSPLTRRHHFNYAVHNIGVDNLPVAPAEHSVHLLAWRKPDDAIGFMQLNALSASLLELIGCNRHETGQALLLQVAHRYSEFDPAVIFQGGADALQSFHNNHIVFLKHPQKEIA